MLNHSHSHKINVNRENNKKTLIKTVHDFNSTIFGDSNRILATVELVSNDQNSEISLSMKLNDTFVDDNQTIKAIAILNRKQLCEDCSFQVSENKKKIHDSVDGKKFSFYCIIKIKYN